MTSNEDHFDEFQDHTLLKHAIVDAYLKAWSTKLLNPRGKSLAVHFVDAFAGCGKDLANHRGSPLLAMDVALMIRGMARDGQIRPNGKMLVTAIEQRVAHFTRLVEASRSECRQMGENACLLRGDLAAHLDTVVARGNGAPMLTFLDPYGLGGLKREFLPALLAGPKDEVFALFAHIGAVRLHGVLNADSSRFYEPIEREIAQASLFPEHQQERVASLRADAIRREQHLEATAAPSRQIMEDLFGDDPEWIAEIQSVPLPERAAHFVTMFSRRLRDAGARYIVVLPMRDADGVPKYTLVHASKAPVAVRTMKEAICAKLSVTTDLSPIMRARIRQDLTISASAVADDLELRYAGRTMAWSKDPATDSEASAVRAIALETTPIFQFQCDALRDEFKRRGWFGFLPGTRSQAVMFPATPG